VIGESVDFRLVFVDADDSFDYANGNLGFVERAALLDVQFHIATKGMRGEARLREPCWVAANLSKAIFHPNTVVDAAEDALVQPAGRRGTADQIFFVRPDDHFEGMPGGHMIFLEGLHHLNGRHRAQVAVEIASVGYRIDVRTKKNAWRGRRQAGTHPKNVSCGIDARPESSLVHRLRRVIAARHIRVRISNTAYAIGKGPARGPPVNTQILESAPEARGIDAQTRRCLLASARPGHGESRKHGGHGIQ
jgi:hypothetical protein